MLRFGLGNIELSKKFENLAERVRVLERQPAADWHVDWGAEAKTEPVEEKRGHVVCKHCGWRRAAARVACRRCACSETISEALYLKSIDGRPKGLSTWQRELDERERSLEKREAGLDEEARKLDDRHGAMTSWKATLNTREDEVEKRERKLVEREQELDERDTREQSIHERERTLDVRARNIEHAERTARGLVESDKSKPWICGWCKRLTFGGERCAWCDAPRGSCR